MSKKASNDPKNIDKATKEPERQNSVVLIGQVSHLTSIHLRMPYMMEDQTEGKKLPKQAL